MACDSVISPMILSVWWASNGVSSYWLSRLLHFSSDLGLCFRTDPIVSRGYTSSCGLSLLNVFREFLHPQLEVHTQSVISLLLCVFAFLCSQVLGFYRKLFQISILTTKHCHKSKQPVIKLMYV